METKEQSLVKVCTSMCRFSLSDWECWLSHTLLWRPKPSLQQRVGWVHWRLHLFSASWTLPLLQLCLTYSWDVVCHCVVLTCRCVWILISTVPVMYLNVASSCFELFCWSCSYLSGIYGFISTVWTAEILYSTKNALLCVSAKQGELLALSNEYATEVWTSTSSLDRVIFEVIFVPQHSFFKRYMLWLLLMSTVSSTVMKAVIVWFCVFESDSDCCSFAMIEGNDWNKEGGGEEARALLENLSKSCLIIVRVHESFPCLLYSHQLVQLFLFLSLNSLLFFLFCCFFPSLPLYLPLCCSSQDCG